MAREPETMPVIEEDEPVVEALETAPEATEPVPVSGAAYRLMGSDDTGWLVEQVKDGEVIGRLECESKEAALEAMAGE